ncbi:hypothetical protein F2Q69_00053156 [Brassica cretica]|uniref:Uncharacterized protein n=1 Tax=Brassica cretica TaxID=69181 RepID=A0A8S9N286_BRACR|nr:hypothetical protein F2Q69_00053156 [Brassica cretica]
MRLQGWDPGIGEDLYHNDKIGRILNREGIMANRIFLDQNKGWVSEHRAFNEINGREVEYKDSIPNFLRADAVLMIQIFGLEGRILSQLVGKVGDLKNGEGTRKRLKISVPLFDNSDLIKSYSKTLIGRCMNPEEQDVKGLLVMLPKIWKDLGSRKDDRARSYKGVVIKGDVSHQENVKDPRG